MTATQEKREYKWRIIVNDRIAHSGQRDWGMRFDTELAARAYAETAFVEGAVRRIERVDVTPRKERHETP